MNKNMGRAARRSIAIHANSFALLRSITNIYPLLLFKNMDNKEVALELLKIFLETHRERVELDELIDAYLYILDILEHGHQGQEPPGGSSAPQNPPQSDDDSLFDFKQPLSVSDKEG